MPREIQLKCFLYLSGEVGTQILNMECCTTKREISLMCYQEVWQGHIQSFRFLRMNMEVQ